MIELGVTGIPAVLEPRTSASATTKIAGFLGGAALGAGHRGSHGFFCEYTGINERTDTHTL